jgi:F0F1-type ATP synthase epsilon subunit
MKVRIHAVDKTILDAEATEVVLPGWDGEFTAMDFHQPCLYALRAGKIRVKRQKTEDRRQKTEEKIAIKKGVAKIASNELIALVEA